MSRSTSWTRCVVLIAGDSGCRDAAQQAVAARDWQGIDRDDPFDAMQELCVREQASAARAAWGMDRTERAALLIVEPDRWPQRDDLLAAVQRYLPSAGILELDGEQLTEIVAVTLPEPPQSTPMTPPTHHPSQGAPTLRLAGVTTATSPDDADEPEGESLDEDQAPATMQPEITAEEIRMLLDSKDGGP